MSQAADIERFADEVARHAAHGDWRVEQRAAAVERLVLALSDDWVSQDADAEDAVCSALEAIGVMKRVGNLMFEIVPEADLSEHDAEAIRRCRVWLPRRYRGRRC